MPLQRNLSKGFTLIEVIMTIIVVTIVAIPLSLLLSQHVRSAFQSESLTIARQLARLEMEKVNNTGYPAITSANFPNYEGYDYNLDRIVTYAYGDTGSAESLKKIMVKVAKSGDSKVLINLVTYIAKNIVYGL